MNKKIESILYVNFVPIIILIMLLFFDFYKFSIFFSLAIVTGNFHAWWRMKREKQNE